MHDALSARYADAAFVRVMHLGEDGAKGTGLHERDEFLRPDVLKDTNELEYCSCATTMTQGGWCCACGWTTWGRGRAARLCRT